MSEKRLNGWEPREFHEHEYDKSGRLVRTVVTRESEWDDFEVEKMQGLALYESEVCACGLHKSIADQDPELQLTMRRCPVCAGMEKAMRQIQADDEKAVKALGPKPPPEADRPTDGRSFGVKPKVSAEMTRLLRLMESRSSDVERPPT